MKCILQEDVPFLSYNFEHPLAQPYKPPLGSRDLLDKIKDSKAHPCHALSSAHLSRLNGPTELTLYALVVIKPP